MTFLINFTISHTASQLRLASEPASSQILNLQLLNCRQPPAVFSTSCSPSAALPPAWQGAAASIAWQCTGWRQRLMRLVVGAFSLCLCSSIGLIYAWCLFISVPSSWQCSWVSEGLCNARDSQNSPLPEAPALGLSCRLKMASGRLPPPHHCPTPRTSPLRESSRKTAQPSWQPLPVCLLTCCCLLDGYAAAYTAGLVCLHTQTFKHLISAPSTQ